MNNNQKQAILDKITELDNQNISITEADAWIANYLIKVMPEEIRIAYDKMISNKIPF